MNKYLLPLKREVWEHNGTFIKMPIIVVLLFTVMLLFMAMAAGKGISNSSYFNFSEYSYDGEQSEIRQFEFNDRVIGEAQSIPASSIGDHYDFKNGLKISAQSPYVLLNGIMLLVAFSYLLGSLLADRKDNSILFWKSMPVSETQNVLNKVFVVTFLLPAIAWVASLVLSIVIFILTVGLSLFIDIEGLPAKIWQHSSVIETSWSYIGNYIAISLWLLPVTAWLLFASAFTKKNAFLTAALPLIVIVIVEKYLFGSHHLIRIFFQHSSGIINGQEMPFMILNPEGWSQLSTVLSSQRFWLTLPITGALTYGAIWFRENRYEG